MMSVGQAPRFFCVTKKQKLKYLHRVLFCTLKEVSIYAFAFYFAMPVKLPWLLKPMLIIILLLQGTNSEETTTGTTNKAGATVSSTIPTGMHLYSKRKFE